MATTTTNGRRYAYHVAYYATLNSGYRSVTGSQRMFLPAPITTSQQVTAMQDEIAQLLQRQGNAPNAVVITWWAPLPGDDYTPKGSPQ